MNKKRKTRSPKTIVVPAGDIAVAVQRAASREAKLQYERYQRDAKTWADSYKWWLSVALVGMAFSGCVSFGPPDAWEYDATVDPSSRTVTHTFGISGPITYGKSHK